MTPWRRFCHAARLEKQGEFRLSTHEPGSAPTPFPAEQPAERPAEQKFWPQGWWRLMEFRIGVIPLPVYVITLGVLTYFQLQGQLPTEINVAIAVLAIGG